MLPVFSSCFLRCSCADSVGEVRRDGIPHGTTTAGGVGVREGVVAADPHVLPLGTVIRLENAGPYNGTYTVLDTGTRIQGRRLDVFLRDCGEAVRFGRGDVRVSIKSCGRDLTGSWSKGRSEYYAYYHCRAACRAVNVSKARLEGLFAEELALLQPTPGYMRLLKESVLQIWKARKAAVRDEIATAERAAKAVQAKLDRLDEAFLFERSIDIETYDRYADKLRQELTLVRIDRHSGQLEELDVEGILAFAERVLPRASDLCVQAAFRSGCVDR